MNIERKTTVYHKFRGVDYSVDSSLVSEYRSPYAPNLISDIGGLPEKRVGWRSLHRTEGRINGLFHCVIDGKEHRVAHVGTKIYRWDEEAAEAIFEGINDARSTSFFMGGKLYLLTGAEYLVFDGETVKDVCEEAYVPLVMASKNPDGTGGARIDDVNLLTRKQTEGFYGNETDKVFHLSKSPVESVDKVEIMNAEGAYEETEAFTADLEAGTVTFSAVQKPVQPGEDNVKITYTRAVEEDDPALCVKKCTVAATFGYSGDNYVFVSGNPEEQAKDWRSGAGDPTYFPDLGYSIIGSEESAVMGYQKLGKYLIIIKEENKQDTTIYQRWASVTDGGVEFYMEPGIAGVGAVSKNCFFTLMDEPLFLSRRGIMAIYSTNILSERTVKNRSHFIDAALTKETDMEEAVATVWNGLYLLAVNGNCYVLDSKNKSMRSNRTEDSSEYIYEAYHWTNIPARVWLELGGELFFGTEDGRICKFNTDMGDSMMRFNDDGEAICCCWATKNDDDGAGYLLKSMQKKGCTVTIKPFYRSSAEVYVSKDGDAETFVRRHNMDIMTWWDIDFERFSFITNDSPQDVYLKKKVKKYKRLQIFVYNRGLNEGFGIFQIVKTYRVGNYAKK